MKRYYHDHILLSMWGDLYWSKYEIMAWGIGLK